MHTFENRDPLPHYMAKLLMLSATSDNNKNLAELFAAKAEEMGHEASVIDLVELDMPMFTVAR